jgi:hypothetical protein
MFFAQLRGGGSLAKHAGRLGNKEKKRPSPVPAILELNAANSLAIRLQSSEREDNP